MSGEGSVSLPEHRGPQPRTFHIGEAQPLVQRQGEAVGREPIEVALSDGLMLEGRILFARSVPIEKGAVYSPYEPNVGVQFTEKLLDPIERHVAVAIAAYMDQDVKQFVLHGKRLAAIQHPNAATAVYVRMTNPQIKQLERVFAAQMEALQLPEGASERQQEVERRWQAVMAAHPQEWAKQQEIVDHLRLKLVLPPFGTLSSALTVASRHDPRAHNAQINYNTFYPDDYGPFTTAQFVTPAPFTNPSTEEGFSTASHVRAARLLGQSGCELRLPQEVLDKVEMQFVWQDTPEVRRAPGVLTPSVRSRPLS